MAELVTLDLYRQEALAGLATREGGETLLAIVERLLDTADEVVDGMRRLAGG